MDDLASTFAKVSFLDFNEQDIDESYIIRVVPYNFRKSDFTGCDVVISSVNLL